LQGVALHDLIQVENLARSTGVFAILSGDRVGYLHMSQGELIHAEAQGLSGEAAALEILSWHEGEFRNCERMLAQVSTVHASLQALLLRLAKESDEARHLDNSSLASTGTRRRDTGRLVSERPIAAASRATRLSADGLSRAEVLLNDRGELLDGRGHGYDEFASEVAYAARLAELIGQALGAGELRAMGVHGKSNELLIRRLPNANVLGIVRAVKGGESVDTNAERAEDADEFALVFERAEDTPVGPASKPRIP
jgi:hypothetical protein